MVSNIGLALTGLCASSWHLKQEAVPHSQYTSIISVACRLSAQTAALPHSAPGHHDACGLSSMNDLFEYLSNLAKSSSLASLEISLTGTWRSQANPNHSTWRTSIKCHQRTNVWHGTTPNNNEEQALEKTTRSNFQVTNMHKNIPFAKNYFSTAQSQRISPSDHQWRNKEHTNNRNCFFSHTYIVLAFVYWASNIQTAGAILYRSFKVIWPAIFTKPMITRCIY